MEYLFMAYVARRRTGADNWEHLVQRYDALLANTGSPVVAINRAVAVAERQDPVAGLDALAKLESAGLAEYQPFWAARAELLARSGAAAEACRAYEISIGLERDPSVRYFLQQRHSDLVAPESRRLEEGDVI